MTVHRHTALEHNHFAFLHRLECVITGQTIGLHAAHIRYADHAAGKAITGMGAKPDPFWTLPILARLHMEQHDAGNEREWWRSHGFDPDSPSLSPLTLALALWRYSEAGDVESARAEIAQHRMNIRLDRQEREHFAEPPQIDKPVKRRRAPGPKGRSTIPTRTAKLPSRPFQKTHRPLRGKRTKETT